MYVETSVVSYVTAALSRDLITAAHQQITQEWWSRRNEFSLYVSDAVVDEAGRGHPEAAAARLAALRECSVLAVNATVGELAERLLRSSALPAKAAIDAVHVAVAAVNGMDFLLTWNCAHLANAATRGKIERTCRIAGFPPPIICTPEELGEV